MIYFMYWNYYYCKYVFMVFAVWILFIYVLSNIILAPSHSSMILQWGGSRKIFRSFVLTLFILKAPN